MLLTLLKAASAWPYIRTKVSDNSVQAGHLNPVNGHCPCECDRVLLALKLLPAMSAFEPGRPEEGWQVYICASGDSAHSKGVKQYAEHTRACFVMLERRQ